MFNLQAVICIVECGKGSKVLRRAIDHGVKMGTICIGLGTVKSKMLELLDLNEVEKEIVIMLASSALADAVMEDLYDKMTFYKKNHGIVFSFALSSVFGVDISDDSENIKVVEKPVYNAIFTVVDRGLAEDVVESASKAGARGGTIIHGRGAGAEQIETVFHMQIEPEKEIALILCLEDITAQITEAICRDMHIDEPNKGILFVVPLSEVRGIY